MRCPQCRDSELVEGSLRDARLHGCAGCGGVWLDNAMATRLLERIGAARDATELADRAASNALVPFPAHAERPPCPTCGASMDASRVGGDSGEVLVDVCTLHGTWFDRNELQAIARHLHAARPTPVGAEAPAWFDAPAEPVGAYVVSPPPSSGRSSAYVEGAATLLDVLLEVLTSTRS